MTSILTFCTANISASVFNRLNAESQEAEYGCPFLCLIRTPDQQDVDEWGTEGPIDDFETGFVGQTDDELRHYYRRFLAERGTMGTISENWMAVLDENSASQSAVVMYYGMKKSDWDEFNEDQPDEPIPGTGTVCDDGYIWWKWRIPFRNAYSFFTGLDSTGEELLELYCHPEYLSADGVLDVESVDKVMDGKIPDTYGILKNRVESEDES